MAKLWSALYDAVIPYLPGYPVASADYLIKRAAIEFFDRSCAWRVAIPAFTATVDVATYTLAAPVATTTIAKVLEFRYIGRELEHLTPEQLRVLYGTQDWRALASGVPQYWTSEAPNEVTLIAKPNATTASALSGWAAIKPLDDATGIATDAMWREYYDQIAKMARARAMEIPKKPYSNAVEARRLMADLDGEIGMIAYHVTSGRGGTRRTVTRWI